MRTIAVVTSTRAEYGILYPLIRRILSDPDLSLQLYVTGTHLSEKHGYTIKEIEKDNVPIYKKIPILEEGNSSVDITRTMANAMTGFSKYFHESRSDMLVLLGDRTEILAVALAAMNENIPIAHIHGGEVTEGAVDDAVRHCLSKLSYLHFTSTEVYRHRVIQLGETPDRVFNVGALSTENILNVPLISREKLFYEIGIKTELPLVTVTFHPVTKEQGEEIVQTQSLIEAMKVHPEYFYLITMANADAGGDMVNMLMKQFEEDAPDGNVKVVASLGMRRYLSAVRESGFVLGNSSSGIIEAPVMGTPTVNVGDRQKGRLQAGSIINCDADTSDIADAMEKAGKAEHRRTLMYGDGHTDRKSVV